MHENIVILLAFSIKLIQRILSIWWCSNKVLLQILTNLKKTQLNVIHVCNSLVEPSLPYQQLAKDFDVLSTILKQTTWIAGPDMTDGYPNIFG